MGKVIEKGAEEAAEVITPHVAPHIIGPGKTIDTSRPPAEILLLPGIPIKLPDLIQDIAHKGGLGAKPNSVPTAEPKTDEPGRLVYIGSHPIGGAFGKLVYETLQDEKFRTGGGLPDPTTHWAVLVGDFYHELTGGELFVGPDGISGGVTVAYQNGKKDEEKWNLYVVGTTRFNDAAIVKAASTDIKAMSQSYNLIDNNCQCYVTRVLDSICEPGRNIAITSAQLPNGTIPFYTKANAESIMNEQDRKSVV